MTEYSVGDRVRVKQATWTSKAGQLGTVRTVSGAIPLYRVKYDGGGYDWFRVDDLNLAPGTVYKMTVPPEPEGVERVRPVGREDLVYVKAGPNSWYREGHVYALISWEQLVTDYFRGVEPVPAKSEFDAAVRWFDHSVVDDLAVGGASLETFRHAAAIVRHVVEQERPDA